LLAVTNRFEIIKMQYPQAVYNPSIYIRRCELNQDEQYIADMFALADYGQVRAIQFYSKSNKDGQYRAAIVHFYFWHANEGVQSLWDGIIASETKYVQMNHVEGYWYVGIYQPLDTKWVPPAPVIKVPETFAHNDQLYIQWLEIQLAQVAEQLHITQFHLEEKSKQLDSKHNELLHTKLQLADLKDEKELQEMRMEVQMEEERAKRADHFQSLIQKIEMGVMKIKREEEAKAAQDFFYAADEEEEEEGSDKISLTCESPVEWDEEEGSDKISLTCESPVEWDEVNN
jgi:hypothetical protein